MITEGLKGRDFISLRDFTREEIADLLAFLEDGVRESP